MLQPVSMQTMEAIKTIGSFRHSPLTRSRPDAARLWSWCGTPYLGGLQGPASPPAKSECSDGSGADGALALSRSAKDVSGRYHAHLHKGGGGDGDAGSPKPSHEAKAGRSRLQIMVLLPRHKLIRVFRVFWVAIELC